MKDQFSSKGKSGVNFWKNKKGYIILFFTFLFFLFLTIFLSNYFIPVGFLSLVIVFLLSGLGIAWIFEKQFQFYDLFSYLTNSLVLGIFTDIFLLQILGLMGINYTDSMLCIFFSGIILANFTLLLFLTKSWDFNLKQNRSKLTYVDIIGFLIITILFFMLANICLENYTYTWDSFTFWGVDSKYIFENRALRDKSFDVLSEAKYSSLYSSLLFLTYIFFGGVYEQYSSLITLFFAFLGSMLLFNKARFLTSIQKKAVIYISLVIVIVSFLLPQNIIISQYADVFSSFLVLFFSIVLLDSKKFPITDYYKRFLLISLICFSFSLTKTLYAYVGIALFLLYLVYDIKILQKKFVTIIRQKGMIFSVVFLGVYFFLIQKYLSTFPQPEFVPFESQVVPLGDYFKYIYDLIIHISGNLPFMMLLYGSFLTMLFLNPPKNKKGWFAIIIFVSVTLIPIVFFVFNLRQDFGSKSLLRYITLGSFLIPYSYSFLKVSEENKFKKFLSTVLMILLSFIIIFIVYFRYGMGLKWTINDGKYSTPLSKYYNIAERAKEEAGKNSKIIIVDSLDEAFTNLANMDVPGIFLRYYLEEYSVGKQYSLPPEQFEDYLNEFVNPDYLLILEYDGYFIGCNNSLSLGASYLIPYQRNSQLFNKDICPFNTNDIIDLEQY